MAFKVRQVNGVVEKYQIEPFVEDFRDMGNNIGLFLYRNNKNVSIWLSFVDNIFNVRILANANCHIVFLRFKTQ